MTPAPLVGGDRGGEDRLHHVHALDHPAEGGEALAGGVGVERGNVGRQDEEVGLRRPGAVAAIEMVPATCLRPVTAVDSNATGLASFRASLVIPPWTSPPSPYFIAR